jgi:thioredoxin 1
MSDFIEINEANFDLQVLKSVQPVVLEFGAVWCGPCKRLEPILKQLSQEWAGKARFAKVDVDQSSDLAIKYGIMGVPTVILFQNGEVQQRLTGLQSRERLIEKFQPYLRG